MSRTTDVEALYTWAIDYASEADEYAELLRAWRDDLRSGLGQQIEHARRRLATARKLYIAGGVTLDAAIRASHEEHTLVR